MGVQLVRQHEACGPMSLLSTSARARYSPTATTLRAPGVSCAVVVPVIRLQVGPRRFIESSKVDPLWRSHSVPATAKTGDDLDGLLQPIAALNIGNSSPKEIQNR
jgi:hypothetical protein